MFEIKIQSTGKRIQIASKDIEGPRNGRMEWMEAKKACNKLGEGWRLPTIIELEIIYKELHLKGIGNFKEDGYWSSKVGNHRDFPTASYFCFSDACERDHWQTIDNYLRAVRNI